MNDTLIQYLIDNHQYFREKYKDLLCEKKSIKAKEHVVFHDDIDLEFKSVVIRSMSGEIALATGADMESIMIVLEDMNIMEFFK